MSAGLSQLGRFTSGAATEALQQMQRAGGGTILITSGLRDLRFSVRGDSVTLEALGYALGNPPDLVREFLSALFWEDPSFILDGPGAVDAHPQAKVVEVNEIVVAELLGELMEGCGELGQLHQRVPGIETLVTVKGEPPPPDVTEPSAQLFRALDGMGAQRGGILSVAADEAGIDPIDAAWIVDDLTSTDQAELKSPPAPLVARRLKRAEALAGGGFSRGLRYSHLGRAHARVDGRRASHFQRMAGQAYLTEGKSDQAIAAYRSCLAAQSDDVASMEGLITALEKSGQTDDALRLRKEASKLYLQWGMPGRAREHLQVIGDKSFEQRNVLLECMLRQRDFQSAIDLAAGLGNTMPEQGKQALAARFIEAGATGKARERAIGLAGIKSSGGARKVLWLVLLLGLVGAALVGGEIYCRMLFQQASAQSRTHLEAGDFDAARQAFAPLQQLIQQAGGQTPPPPLALSQVAPALDEIDAIEADAALLKAEAATLAWRKRGDTQASLAALQKLLARCQSPAGQARVEAVRAEVEAYRKKVGADVANLEQKVISGKLDEALELAQTLQTQHADAADLWADAEVSVRLEIRTTAGTEPRLQVDGESKPLTPDPERPGSYQGEVRLPLGPRAVVVTLTSPPNHVERKLELRCDAGLTTSYLDLLLIEVRPLRDATPPPGAGSPGLFVVEDQQALTLAERVARTEVGDPNAKLVPEDSTPLFESLRPLLGESQRLVIFLDSEVRFSRLAFKGIEVFLKDVNSGARAQPRSVAISPLGEVTRSLDDQGGGTVTVPNLSAVGDVGAIVDAIKTTLGEMQRELR